MNTLHSPNAQPRSKVLVVGGGIGGMRAALDLADAGLKVYLPLFRRAGRTTRFYVSPA